MPAVSARRKYGGENQKAEQEEMVATRNERRRAERDQAEQRLAGERERNGSRQENRRYVTCHQNRKPCGDPTRMAADCLRPAIPELSAPLERGMDERDRLLNVPHRLHPRLQVSSPGGLPAQTNAPAQLGALLGLTYARM